MYSVAIVIVMALLMAAVIILEFYSLEKKSVYDKGIFLIFSLVAIGFAVGRPTGIVSDDYGYEPKFNALCPVMECGQWIQSSRDFAWYTLVAFLKSFFDTPRVMLWMSGFFLTIKLAVIYLLTSRKALALLIYMAVFYIIQDVIAFRVSSAAAIYLLGFYLASRKCFISTSLASFISGAFHAQAILAPLSLIGLWSKPRAQWVNAMIWVPMILLMFGLYPSIDWVKPLINEHSVIRSVSQGLSEMLVFFAKGDREQVRPMPLVVPPLLFLVIYIYNRGIPDKNYMLRYAYFSTGIASLFLWLLAHNASPQLRIFHFFLAPLPILIGNASFSRGAFYGVIGVSVIFVMKYNVLHQLLFDYRKLNIPVISGGYLMGVDSGVSCGEGCYKHKLGNSLWLKAHPDSGYRFMGWESACQKYKKEPICLLVMNQDWTALPVFKEPFTLSLGRSNLGRVTSPNGVLDCGENCQVQLNPESTTTLYAHPIPGYYLAEWLGPCLEDSYIDCKIKMLRNVEVKPVYAELIKHLLLVEKVENARIVSDPPGIDCGGDSIQCFGEFNEVELRVDLAPGFGFSRWLGCVDDDKILCHVILHDDSVVSIELF